ncbi:hypothetical protein HPB49_008795 [Dermacentor silvarum]|uniref:Uncharacterized protein n=1 Tax=Dermacentor silvarum TaxID=543639 RepID=A0ACB8DYR8_DERSI|nr:hypothetical protein HPB49_008795 [Dermacentor silvarum]
MSEDSGDSRAEMPEAGEVAISIESFQHSQKNVHFYTGLPDYVAFEDLYWRLADDTVGRHATPRRRRHFDDDYYGNGKCYLKDGSVPHIFTGSVPKKGTAKCRRPVPDTASFIATFPRNSDIPLLRPQHGHNWPFTIIMDTAVCRCDEPAPNINSAVVEVKCEDEVEKREDDIEERVTVDPIHTYCNPTSGNRVKKEVGVDPECTSCDEPSEVSHRHHFTNSTVNSTVHLQCTSNSVQWLRVQF